VVAWDDALGEEVVGEAVGSLLQLGVRASLRTAHEGLAVAARVGGHLPDVGEVERSRGGDHRGSSYLMATGLVGAPTPPVTGSGLATSSIS
jgi:hypothetical protein